MNFMNRVIVACCILLCTSVWKISAQDYPFRRADLPVEERVEDLVRRMTLEEKIDLLAGYQDFYLHPCERLGIPAFKLADGPLGLASWGLFGKATAFPSALSLAAVLPFLGFRIQISPNLIRILSKVGISLLL